MIKWTMVSNILLIPRSLIYRKHLVCRLFMYCWEKTNCCWSTVLSYGDIQGFSCFDYLCIIVLYYWDSGLLFSLCSGCLCVKLMGGCLYPFCIPILFPLRPCFAFCLWFLPCLPHSRTYQIKINLHLAEGTAVVTSAVSRRSSCFSTKQLHTCL